MKILFVCHRLPYPPSRGGKIRPFNMIRHLSTRHSLVVASLADSPEELAQGRKLEELGVELIAEVVPRRARWRQAVAALPTTLPSSVAYFWSSTLQRRIRETAARSRFDAVLVHCAFVGRYVADVAAPLRWMDFGDLDSAKWAAYSRHRSLPLSGGYWLESQKLRRFERALARTFTRLSATTPGEVEAVSALGVDRPCHLIPNGVDTSYFSTVADPGRTSSTVAFLGRMDYFPNVDAVQYFAQEVFPIVRRTLPRAEFAVVGANPTAAIRRLGQLPGVRVTGTVPDVRPFLAECAISVAPLRIARGTQNKILESMAMGVPVVATPDAAKGIRATPGEHLIVAANPGDFARSVILLLQDAEQRRRLAEAGRRQVERAHRWESSMASLDALLTGTPQPDPAT